jgi:murein DD-endopeptidase MepM/ murein hydrolase activator NlpD
MKKSAIVASFLIGLALLLTGCRDGLSQSDNAEENPANQAMSAAADLQGALSTPLTSNEEPLQFNFPTPEAPPVSAWRPPLYEVPWALGEHDHFLFTRPIAADEVNWPLANYRYGDYFSGTDIVHTGIDIDAKRGTPVLATGDGTITWAGWGLYRGKDSPDDPYGLAVAIRHDFGYIHRQLYTIYAHMDRIDVSVGQHVSTGDQLGIVGDTGNTTGPHLHYEVRIENNSYYVTRNPELWLSPPQGWGVLVGRLMKQDGTTISGMDVTISSVTQKRKWGVRTYAPSSVNSDDYYRENLVLSDLPAGDYSLDFTFNDGTYTYNFTILPGTITYFTFRENYGFRDSLPSAQADADWTPSDLGTPPAQ